MEPIDGTTGGASWPGLASGGAGADFSTLRMPRLLVILTAAFLGLRILLTVAAPSEAVTGGGAIPWIDAREFRPVMNRGRKLVVYEFRADWSEPCKRMDETTFASKQVVQVLNSQFVTVRVTDRQKEDGKNTPAVSDLEKRFHVSLLPTLVITRPDGGEVSTLVGSTSALSTYHFLTRAVRSGSR